MVMFAPPSFAGFSYRPPPRRQQRRPNIIQGQPASNLDYGDRSALQREKYNDDAALIAQRQANRMANIEAPSQAERLHMLKLQHGLVGVQQAIAQGVLTPEQGAAMRTQIQTGLSPYLLKQQQFSAALADHKLRSAMENAEIQRKINKVTSGFLDENPNGYEEIPHADGSTTFHGINADGKHFWHEHKAEAAQKALEPQKALLQAQAHVKGSNPEYAGKSAAELAADRKYGQAVNEEYNNRVGPPLTPEQMGQAAAAGGFAAAFARPLPGQRAPGSLPAPATAPEARPASELSDKDLRGVLGLPEPEGE